MNLVKANVACNTCQFWDTESYLNTESYFNKDGKLEYAICCRYPPTPVACSFKVQDTSDDSVYPVRIEGFWPATKCTSWCGEHKFNSKKLTK
jgi:hypothetical protein